MANITDEQLAKRATQGDWDAFAVLYDRYFQGFYDLAVRMVGSPDLGADLVQSSFLDAWENLRKRRVEGNIKAWLYTIVRNNAINELRRRKRSVRSQKLEDAAAPLLPDSMSHGSKLSDPQTALVDNELLELVWDSAKALNPKEYSLLDLHLRKGLSADELATALGVRKANVYTMLSRLKHSLEESVTAAILMRRGRRDCPELNALLLEQAPELTRDTRRVIQRHLQECPVCQESKKRYLAPAEIFSGIALIPVLMQQRASIWQRVSEQIASNDAGLGTMAQTPVRRVYQWARSTAKSKIANLGIALPLTGALAISLVVVSPGEERIIEDLEDIGSTSQEMGRSPPSKTGGHIDPFIMEGQELDTASFSPGQTPPVEPAAGEPTGPTNTSSPSLASTPNVPLVPTSTPTVLPTPIPTPTPSITPTPTPTPPPVNEAGIKVVAVTVVSPVSALTGEEFQVSGSADLLNTGPAQVVLVDTTFSLNAPGDCLVSPNGPVTVQDQSLPVGIGVTINRVWLVNCSATGQHMFSVDVTTALDPGETAIDPDLSDNSNSGADTTEILSA